MSRSVWIGLLTTVLFGAVSAVAVAQRDAGAKARGDMRGFWDQRPAVSRVYRGPVFYQPAPATEGYRRFSYEPVAIGRGDTVVVDVDRAKLMSGPNQVGTLAKGREFQVTRVINGWLGAVVEENGKELKGWIWHRNVLLDRAGDRSPDTAGSVGPPQRAYRRFSFEPSERMRYAPPATSRRAQRRPTPPEVRLHPGIRRY